MTAIFVWTFRDIIEAIFFSIWMLFMLLIGGFALYEKIRTRKKQ